MTAADAPSNWLLTAGLGAVVGALGYALWYTRPKVKHLRRRLQHAMMSLEQLQLSFGRFAPQVVVERIIASGVSTSTEKKTVTVLFADIVGFTALSERMEATLLVQILNGYFARMSPAIAEHRGHVSKFIGDGILALFGALEPNPWQPMMPSRRRLRCARPSRSTMKYWRRPANRLFGSASAFTVAKRWRD